MINIGAWVHQRARLHPQRHFLKQDGWSCGNAEFSRRVSQAVGALTELGLEPGERVATVMENGSAFLELLFACAAIGAILVPLNTNLASTEAARLLADCRPRIGIHSRRFATMLAAIDNPAGTWFEHAGGTLAAAQAMTPQTRDPGDKPPACRDAALDDPLLLEKINYLFAVPVIFAMMARSPAWSRADFSHMRILIAGGAAMPVDLIRRYQEEKQVRFAQGYGMTETQRIAALDLESTGSRAGSIGKEVFHTQLRLVDDDGQEVPTGATGEIVVKGPTVFLGYWNQSRATARVLRDGWFHTGDMGRRDEAGYLYIVGRKSEVIISAGENIYAAQVEQAMQRLPQVAEAAVFAVADPQRGGAVAAAVVLHAGVHCTTDRLLAQLKGVIADFQRPRKIWIVDALPRNDAGKVLKEQLRTRLQ
jgi:acyl-CoA synthetase (AMP-forming)/AMP-acid ligase II